MRVAVYLDQAFWTDGEDVFAARSFVEFLGPLAARFDDLVVTARLSPKPADSHYKLPAPARFEALPHYGSAASVREVGLAMRDTMRRFGSILDQVDAVWLLGPHPFALAFARLAARKGKRVVLGVRQDFPAYVAGRHPRRPDLRLLATVLERAFRHQARRHPVIAVGPELASHYADAIALLEIYVSLIAPAEVLPPETVDRRDYSGTVRLLSVGRLDPEKNPLQLIDVIAGLDERWHLTICGDGPLEPEVRSAIEARGLQERISLRGHVPMGDELLAVYRESHLLLHVSLTEGFPQVLLESFAAALPTVATDVGGIAAAAGPAVALIPAGDAPAAIQALERLLGDPAERRALVDAGNALVRRHTLDSETRRVAEFIAQT